MEDYEYSLIWNVDLNNPNPIWFGEYENQLFYNTNKIGNHYSNRKFINLPKGVTKETHEIEIFKRGEVNYVKLKAKPILSNMDIHNEKYSKIVKDIIESGKKENIDIETASFIFYPVIKSKSKEDENLELRTAWLDGVKWQNKL